MTDDPDRPRVNPGYAWAQLEKAMGSAGATAAHKVAQWKRVLAGLLDGTLRAGSRTPVAATPAWVTLEVVQGGFATGGFSAGGPLLPHEQQQLAALGASERTALNLHLAGGEGRGELTSRLADGRFRIDVPEEAALLIAAWLAERGEGPRADTLVESLLPFFDRLRFYPAPGSTELPGEDGVHLRSAGEVVAQLRARPVQQQVAKMNEATQVWAPLYDRSVKLFLDTIEDGWPCRRYPDGWRERAQQLLDDHAAARRAHTLCGKPDDPKENYARLRGYLATCLADRLTGRDVGAIRRILGAYVARHGEPDGPRRRTVRAAQDEAARQPPHHLLARTLADRLADVPAERGVADVDRRLGPLEAAEASRLGAPVGVALPARLRRIALRCLSASLAVLSERGILPSSESLARLVPAVTARVHGAAVADPVLRRLYQATYLAFRRRRSLLLLDLESQVKLDELPWIAAIAPWIRGDASELARTSLREIATTTLTSFPETILPNPLVKELRALARSAKVDLPLVDELAADIFMGTFASNFVRAAQVAGELLDGSLYERYYRVDMRELRRLAVPKGKTSSAFDALVHGRVAVGGFGVAGNGRVIEQAQIVTTHNLASLVSVLELRLPWADLARRTFTWVISELRRKRADRHDELLARKNAAYAWRQMVFYLSLVPEAFTDFADFAEATASGWPEAFRARFGPELAALRAAGHGQRADRRFLGWV